MLKIDTVCNDYLQGFHLTSHTFISDKKILLLFSLILVHTCLLVLGNIVHKSNFKSLTPQTPKIFLYNLRSSGFELSEQ